MPAQSLDSVISFAKRKGFVYPSSDIYSGFAAVYDYGPLGVLLANNLKALWWKQMVQMRDDMVGLDSAIVMSPKVWEASGHVTGFADPLVEYKPTHERFRVDHLLEAVGVSADEKLSESDIQSLFDEHFDRLELPSKKREDYTPVRRFNLLVQSNIGSLSETVEEPVYLRGETCQGIYVNFKNVLDTVRVSLPFGIAQMGKAFRNEITARQFIFRTREFEQMEMQYFVAPADAQRFFEQWRRDRLSYYASLGISAERLRITPHERLVFYAKAAEDIEYQFPFGWKELEGIHNRGDYDLTQHQTFSGVDLSYRDPHTGETFIPHIVETSTGVGRHLLMVLCEHLDTDTLAGDERTVLRLPVALAPYRVAVFPLVKNKPEIVEKAREIAASLRPYCMVTFDDNGNVGKRYRRQDEIGTPHCITVDYQTLEDGTVTVRDRDTAVQERVSVSTLENRFR